jgi:hypothetical protein
MRWGMLLLSVIGFTFVFSTRSPGVLALGLVFGFGGLFGAVLVMVNERIGASARSEATLLTDKEVLAMRNKAQQSRDRKTPVSNEQNSSASLD